MKPLPLVLIAAAAGSASGLVTQMVAAPAPAPGRSEVAEAPQLAQLEDLVGRVDERLGELETSVDGLRAKVAATPAASDRLPLGEIEDAVDRALAQRSTREERARPRPATHLREDSAAPETELTLNAVLDRLTVDDFAGEMEREEFWQEVRDAGLLDEVVAEFERRAESRPDDPEAQVDLGSVYLQKIFDVGSNGPLAGVWATKADEAFDAALALDDRHWEARFSKAASLSFWPAVFGKQSEAIQQFEILVEQQEQSSPAPQHTQTYLLLGNLYQQNGKPGKALEAWQRGLERFPDSESLIGQIEMTDAE